MVFPHVLEYIIVKVYYGREVGRNASAYRSTNILKSVRRVSLEILRTVYNYGGLRATREYNMPVRMYLFTQWCHFILTSKCYTTFTTEFVKIQIPGLHMEDRFYLKRVLHL